MPQGFAQQLHHECSPHAVEFPKAAQTMLPACTRVIFMEPIKLCSLSLSLSFCRFPPAILSLSTSLSPSLSFSNFLPLSLFLCLMHSDVPFLKDLGDGMGLALP